MKTLEKSQLALTTQNDFPILKRKLTRQNEQIPLVYLDNAATTQKPQKVIDRISYYYSFQNANVHRALHQLGEEATQEYRKRFPKKP